MKEKKSLKKVLHWLDLHFEETILIVFLVLIAVIELMQVIIRRLPFVPALTWAEEFCRFLWIGSVFLSLPYTIRSGTMLRVTAFRDALGEKGKKILDIAVDTVVLAGMVFCAAASFSVVDGIRQSGERSPAMLWPMWIIYSAVLIGFVLASLRAFQHFLKNVEKGGKTWRRHW